MDPENYQTLSLEGKPLSGAGLKVVILEMDYVQQHDGITQDLYQGAVRVLEEQGIDHLRVKVPGVFELPIAMRIIVEATKGLSMGYGVRGSIMRKMQEPLPHDGWTVPKEFPRPDGYITIGSLIRGETNFYEVACGHTIRALQEIAVTYGLAHGFGVLMTDTVEQARLRSRLEGGINKGREAAVACVSMMVLKHGLGINPGALSNLQAL